MTALAALYQEEGKYSEAEPLLTKTLEMDRRVLGPKHSTTATCLTSLAELRLAQHRDAEAESLLRQALNGEEDGGSDAWEPYERRSLLGLSLLEQSKFAEAEQWLVSGYRGFAQRKATIPQGLAVQAGERLVQLYTRWGKADQAAEWRQELQVAGLGTSRPK